MSNALRAIEEDRKAVLALCAQIPEALWAKDSGCPGWSVQDLLSHMACSFWLAVDPTKLPDPGGLPAERAADLYVDSRRSMTPEEVVADYEQVSLRGLEMLAAVAGQDFEVPLGDVGTYPASVVPAAFAFEAFIHIRYDLFPPDGPLEGEPPPADELRLGPTLDWIEASLPQQNASLFDTIGNSVQIRLDGLCARTLNIGAGTDVAAHITTDSLAFVRWVTQRGTWEDLGVRAEGDPSTLEMVRKLRVF
ncbi:maleylpyruvate isomerase family mycothiol-dependent enzyme [Mycobacterium sp.]|uniref:maleylpyruvate isomerase family mycothiol-dependent enzyme n=1 Tax=Mycobacterium sp. TaxID=1785 RepID=UPI002CAFC939|nr:maleylpyruvate isomerase family mycothiol-dependent enzyme [Mycobacterium sp.]HTQ18339.1 maleylpyruvate isomerase family mycothiol-dependent enzyme [Mycobacterium sp.]